MTTYHHGDLRMAILEAAARMVEREGVAGLSVREAARRAGVSHNAPYRHFADRDALLEALAAKGFDELMDVLKDRSGRDLAHAYVRFALEHEQLFRLMFAHQRAADVESRFAAAFAEIGALGGAAAWSLVHGLALLLLDGRFTERDRESFAAGVIGAVRFVQRGA